MELIVEDGPAGVTQAALIGRQRPSRAEGLVRTAIDDVARFTAGADRFDDITCVAAVLA
jgi:hypothetical protein